MLAFLRRVVFPFVKTPILARFGVALVLDRCQKAPPPSTFQVFLLALTINVTSFRCVPPLVALIVVEAFVIHLNLAGLLGRRADILRPSEVPLKHPSGAP